MIVLSPGVIALSRATGGGAVTISGSLPDAKVGTPYNSSLTVAGGPIELVSGESDLLELGFGMTSTGLFTGTP